MRNVQDRIIASIDDAIHKLDDETLGSKERNSIYRDLGNLVVSLRRNSRAYWNAQDRAAKRWLCKDERHN